MDPEGRISRKVDPIFDMALEIGIPVPTNSLFIGKENMLVMFCIIKSIADRLDLACMSAAMCSGKNTTRGSEP
jgi:hypothetical protein